MSGVSSERRAEAVAMYAKCQDARLVAVAFNVPDKTVHAIMREAMAAPSSPAKGKAERGPVFLKDGRRARTWGAVEVIHPVWPNWPHSLALLRHAAGPDWPIIAAVSAVRRSNPVSPSWRLGSSCPRFSVASRFVSGCSASCSSATRIWRALLKSNLVGWRRELCPLCGCFWSTVGRRKERSASTDVCCLGVRSCTDSSSAKDKLIGFAPFQIGRAVMVRRIALIDIDRPDEPLEVEVDELRDAMMVVGVPNTQVKFYLQRRNGSGCFEGSLGGRYFVYDPAKPAKAT